MTVNLKINSVRYTSHWQYVVKVMSTLLLALMFTACSTGLQSRVAGNLNQLSKQQTVAILPVEIMKKDQQVILSLTVFEKKLFFGLSR